MTFISRKTLGIILLTVGSLAADPVTLDLTPLAPALQQLGTVPIVNYFNGGTVDGITGPNYGITSQFALATGQGADTYIFFGTLHAPISIDFATGLTGGFSFQYAPSANSSGADSYKTIYALDSANNILAQGDLQYTGATGYKMFDLAFDGTASKIAFYAAGNDPGNAYETNWQFQDFQFENVIGVNSGTGGTVTPEPASFGLLATCGALLLAIAKWRGLGGARKI